MQNGKKDRKLYERVFDNILHVLSAFNIHHMFTDWIINQFWEAANTNDK